MHGERRGLIKKGDSDTQTWAFLSQIKTVCLSVCLSSLSASQPASQPVLSVVPLVRSCAQVVRLEIEYTVVKEQVSEKLSESDVCVSVCVVVYFFFLGAQSWILSCLSIMAMAMLKSRAGQGKARQGRGEQNSCAVVSLRPYPFLSHTLYLSEISTDISSSPPSSSSSSHSLQLHSFVVVVVA